MNGTRRESGDALVGLARDAIEAFVREDKVLDPDKLQVPGPDRAGGTQ